MLLGPFPIVFSCAGIQSFVELYATIWTKFQQKDASMKRLIGSPTGRSQQSVLFIVGVT